MTHSLSQQNGGLASIATWLVGQLGMVTLALAWVWVAGLRFLWRSGQSLGETIGWPQLVRTADAVWQGLPARQRATAVVFTADYGEAGAINELGRGTGLPAAVSGQNRPMLRHYD